MNEELLTILLTIVVFMLQESLYIYSNNCPNLIIKKFIDNNIDKTIEFFKNFSDNI